MNIDLDKFRPQLSAALELLTPIQRAIVEHRSNGVSYSGIAKGIEMEFNKRMSRERIRQIFNVSIHKIRRNCFQKEKEPLGKTFGGKDWSAALQRLELEYVRKLAREDEARLNLYWARATQGQI